MPNTVPAAAEGLPEIDRRKALAVTGSGLVAALAAFTSPTVKAAALPIPETVHSRVRRLSSELAKAMDEWSADMGEGWSIRVLPASSSEHPIAFENVNAMADARAAATVDTPIMALFREWETNFHRAGKTEVRSEIDALMDICSDLEARMLALPARTAADFAAKYIAHSGYGDFIIEADSPFKAEAAALVRGG